MPTENVFSSNPLEFITSNKFWPSVGRVDNAHGDRNLFCSCIPLEEYSS